LTEILRPVFERFTVLAQQAVEFAQQEAHSLRHKHIGTEHLLLGLLRQPEGPAAHVLASLEVTEAPVGAQVEHLVLSGEELPYGQIQFTPRIKEVFEIALSEAAALGQTYVGPEHLLLAIARENKGVASRVLDEFEADAAKIRSEMMLVLSAGPPASRAPAAAEAARSDRIEVDLSPSARLLLMSAGARALDDGRTLVEPNDLLEAMLAEVTIQSLLSEHGVDVQALRERLQLTRTDVSDFHRQP
jgi:ATP-dependent Clp protease ATP-binding subunit ClpC